MHVRLLHFFLFHYHSTPNFKFLYFILAPSPIHSLQNSREEVFETNLAMYITGPLVGISGVATRM